MHRRTKKAKISSSIVLCGNNLTTLRSQSKVSWLNDFTGKKYLSRGAPRDEPWKALQNLNFPKAGTVFQANHAQCR